MNDIASTPHPAGEESERPVWESMKRGWFGKCPECGHGRMFRSYLSVNDSCPQCGLALSGHRADDAPPYMTIMVVGHVVVPAMLIYDRMATPPLWLQLTIGSLLTLASSLYLLPRIKGALIGLQWSRRMHGFGDEPEGLPSLQN